MAEAFPQTGYTPPVAPDLRNFILEKAQPVQPFPASYKTDISSLPVFHQKKIPDCVENAVTFVKKYHDFSSDGLIADLSRRFLAVLTVIRDGFPLDNGTSIENALYVAYKTGICTSAQMADDHDLPIKEFADSANVTQAQKDDAAKYKISSYAQLQNYHDVNGLKNAIYQNGLVVVGALINENWWTSKSGTVSWLESDILPIRPPTTHSVSVDPTLSGHCFVLYGYDDQYFYFVNSFGPTWGDAGKGYFRTDEVPFIYEAFTIVDLTTEQVTNLKNEISQVQEIITHVDPQNPNKPVILAFIGKVVGLIIQQIRILLS